MSDDVIGKYYKRVARRALIKSSFLGLIVGFFAMLVASVVIFIVGSTELFWIAFIVLAVSFAVSMPLFYFLRYRPSKKDVAAAVDNLGLEERLTTMVELEGSKSFLSARQRADTVAATGSVPVTAIRIAVSTSLIVLLVLAVVFGLGFTGYNILVHADVAPGFDDVVDSIPGIGEEYELYTVTYEEYDLDDYYYDAASDTTFEIGDGEISGERVQFVREGEDCTAVYAEALDESMFLKWVYFNADGTEESTDDPERLDKEIYENMDVYAIFVIVDAEGGGDGDGESEDGEEDEGEGDSGDSSGMGEEDSEEDDGGSSGAMGADGDEGDEESEGSGEGVSQEEQEDQDADDPTNSAGGGGDMDKSVHNGEIDYEFELDESSENAKQESENSGHDGKDSSVEDDYWAGLFG